MSTVQAANKAIPMKAVVQMSSSLARQNVTAAKSSPAASARPVVHTKRMEKAKIAARELRARLSDNTDQSHSVTGSVHANASTAVVASRRRHPIGAKRPTVIARKAQATTARPVCTATNDVGDPVSFQSSGASGGREPAQNAELNSGCSADAS